MNFEFEYTDHFDASDSSSWVRAVYYDRDTQSVGLVSKSYRTLYFYANSTLTPEQFDDWAAAESTGTWWHQNPDWRRGGATRPYYELEYSLVEKQKTVNATATGSYTATPVTLTINIEVSDKVVARKLLNSIMATAANFGVDNFTTEVN